jgi:hypothetical protein
MTYKLRPIIFINGIARRWTSSSPGQKIAVANDSKIPLGIDNDGRLGIPVGEWRFINGLIECDVIQAWRGGIYKMCPVIDLIMNELILGDHHDH